MTRGAARVARRIVAGAVFVGRTVAGGGGRLRHRPEPRPAHGRRGALRVAALGARLPAPPERRDADAPRACARVAEDVVRGGAWPRASRATRRACSRGSRPSDGHGPAASRQARGARRRAPTRSPRATRPSRSTRTRTPATCPRRSSGGCWSRRCARPWSRYPDFDPQRAAARRSPRFSGWRADGILAGNGSNELIEALLLVTVGRRHAGRDPRADVHALRAAHHDPRRRGRAGAASAAELRVRRRGARCGAARRESAARRSTIVCSPNNPTGSVPRRRRDVERLCARRRTASS